MSFSIADITNYDPYSEDPALEDEDLAGDDAALQGSGKQGNSASARPEEQLEEDLEEDLDVVDVLMWAVRDGVAADDISLLAATEAARATGRRAADQSVADEFGVGIRTLYRRNNRTLSALRRCGADYLSAVA